MTPGDRMREILTKGANQAAQDFINTVIDEDELFATLSQIRSCRDAITESERIEEENRAKRDL